MSRDPKQASATLQRYAKRYSAGAFATPTTKELVANPSVLRSSGPWVAVAKKLGRDSKRRDWVGREIVLPRGSTVVTHLARLTEGQFDGADDDALASVLTGVDYVMAYVEDECLAARLDGWGDRVGTRITAASEIIGVWGPFGEAWTESVADMASVGRVSTEHVKPWAAQFRSAVEAEALGVDSWADDFPFYSDGTWDAVSLRGYDRDDPAWGVKPIEMGRKWHAEHPGAIDRECVWTVLADRCPNTLALIDTIKQFDRLERVRFLRMRARDDGKPSVLRRHSDVTDASCGTRDGQMVRFFVPIVTDPSVKLTSWSLDGRAREVHLEPWGLYYLDARKPHAVVNPSNVDRVHLTIDVIVTPQVRELISTL